MHTERETCSIVVRVLVSMTLLHGFTPLLLAAIANRASIVKLLLERGRGSTLNKRPSI